MYHNIAYYYSRASHYAMLGQLILPIYTFIDIVTTYYTRYCSITQNYNMYKLGKSCVVDMTSLVLSCTNVKNAVLSFSECRYFKDMNG